MVMMDPILTRLLSGRVFLLLCEAKGTGDFILFPPGKALCIHTDASEVKVSIFSLDGKQVFSRKVVRFKNQ